MGSLQSCRCHTVRAEIVFLIVVLFQFFLAPSLHEFAVFNCHSNLFSQYSSSKPLSSIMGWCVYLQLSYTVLLLVVLSDQRNNIFNNLYFYIISVKSYNQRTALKFLTTEEIISCFSHVSSIIPLSSLAISKCVLTQSSSIYLVLQTLATRYLNITVYSHFHLRLEMHFSKYHCLRPQLIFIV